MGVVVKVVPPGVEVTGVGVVMVDTGAGVGIVVRVGSDSMVDVVVCVG